MWWTFLMACGGEHFDAGVTEVLDLSFGPDPRQRLDLYLPTEERRTGALVLWVQGGGWNQGDKADNLRAKVDLFTQEGWAVASTNYRLSPNPIDLVDPDAVRAPVHARDVASALGFLADHAALYGLDPARFALVGHSAGAELVARVARAGDQLGAVDVQGVVCLDPVAYDVPLLIGGLERGGADADVHRNAFSSDPTVWGSESAITYVSPDDPPFLLYTRGEDYRRALTAEFALALQGAAVRVELVTTEDLDHMDLNRALGEDEEVTDTVLSFLTGVL